MAVRLSALHAGCALHLEISSGTHLCYRLVLVGYFITKATTGLVPIGYRGALLSSLLQVNVYVTHNLLNVLVQIANKMGLKKL
jgi:ribosomal protein L32E